MKNEEAVVLILDGQGLDDALYKAYDLSTLEDLLIGVPTPNVKKRTLAN